MGFTIIAPRNSIPENPGPIDPPALHDNGVPGASHRWSVERVESAVGSSVAILPDAIGSLPLTYSGEGGNFLLATESGEKHIRQTPSAGSSNLLSSENGVVSFVGAEPYTTAALVRIAPSAGNTSTTATAWIIADGYQLGRASTGVFQASGTGAQTAAGSSNWALLFIVGNSASSVMAVNGTAYGAGTLTGKITTSSRRNRVNIGNGGVATGPSCDIRELTIWPFALDEAQRDAHYAALKAKYASLA